MGLSNCDTVIVKTHQVQLFISGLGKPLCMDVALQWPTTLDVTVVLPRD
jgi:hypothetical protein